MLQLEPTAIDCPYCGERIDVLVDGSVDFQEYIEDCSVCCRPMVIEVASTDGEILSVRARSEDE